MELSKRYCDQRISEPLRIALIPRPGSVINMRETFDLTAIISGMNLQGRNWDICNVKDLKQLNTRNVDTWVDFTADPHYLAYAVSEATESDGWYCARLEIYRDFLLYAFSYSYSDPYNLSYYKVFI